MITRRSLLRTTALAGAASAIRRSVFGAEAADASAGRDLVLSYLESHAREDGGYGWQDQQQSHLTPTYAVIGAYHALGVKPPRAEGAAEFVATHHPAQLKKLEQERRVFEYQQVQALVWLGADPSGFREKVQRWKEPLAYMKAYEQHGWPIFQSEIGAFTCRALLGLPSEDLAPHFVEYLDSRRRENGSFNNTPDADGGDGHVMNTWWGLRALQVLGRAEEKKEETIAWLRACQRPSGGFTWQPEPEFAGIEDAAYTWAAVRALHLLGSHPVDIAACVSWVGSLANSDGGFSDRPGWLSNPLATYYALETLETLSTLPWVVSAPRRPPPARVALPKELKVFSMQIEAHGQGSPAEAVELARALRIDLWGAKNAKPAWLARVQELAEARRVPVRFCVANEEYGTWVRVPGLGTYSHTSDVLGPGGSDIGAPLSNRGIVSWPEFRDRRLTPLEKGRGRLIWQFGENEELVRLFLDDSLERGGYAAISTFHFGNPDFTNSEPFLERWRGQIPYIALQDAHGSEPWWFADMTTGFRTLFLAAEPTWETWLEALKKNWVAAVRHDAVSGGKTWIHTGSREVLELVREREKEWRWWDNPEISRPMISLVAVKPEDEFEAGRFDSGIVLRVRCAWENTAQGLAKSPLVEFSQLTVDGSVVTPALVQKKQGAGYADYYHAYTVPADETGKRTATAKGKMLDSGKEVSKSIEF